MPFRKNHSNYRPCAFIPPVVTKVEVFGDSVRDVIVDSLAFLPDVEDFSPSVQIKAGVPMKDVSTVFKRPSGADYVNRVAELDEDLSKINTNNEQGVNDNEE